MGDSQLDEQGIFEVARKIESRGMRRSYLQQACGLDTALHQRVTDLLRVYEKDDGFLECPPPGLDDTRRAENTASDITPPASESAGTQIGPYKLLEQIAEGGMGIVYMAEQLEPVERRVALKIIKPGMDTRHVIARFQAEWQALAMMDHPNIAKMYDAGTTAGGARGWGLEEHPATSHDGSPQSRVPSPYIGRPYFVMELVRGVPITDYCDEQRLNIRQRMELFILVCHAVGHAHQKGIIHRDLKPSNVMVAQYDDRPVPKIIDFGVAKAAGQRLTDKTLFTHFGQIIGTADYMSPEQARFNQLDIDTRSDIYSLGVLMYELLSGLTPFDHERLHSAAFDEMLRIVREEEPPPPSARLSASERLPAIAAKRQAEPDKLARLVRGELDWIVMKALDKDRARRYQSASSFAADVQNYLNNDAVQACPPSAAYRFRKFARRHKTVLFTTTFVAAALLLGITVATWQAIRATRESAAKAAALVEKDAALGTARQAVDQMLVRVGSDRLNSVPLAHPLRQALFDDALQFYGAWLQQTDESATLREQKADVLNAIGGIERELGQFQAARQSYEGEVELLRKLAIEHPNVPSYLAKQAAAEEDLAYTWQLSPPGPNNDEVDAHYRAALGIYTELEQRWPERPQPVALCLRHLAELAAVRGDRSAAERLWREAIERGEKFLDRQPEASEARSQVGWACVDLWRSMNDSPLDHISEMEEVIEAGLRHAEILLNENPRPAYVRDVTASLHLRLAINHCRTRHVEEAVAVFEQAVREIESLCAECPWNRPYWITARYAHNEAVRSLDAAGCREGAKSLARQMYDWARRMSIRLPDETEPRVDLLKSQVQIASSLQLLGLDEEAADLAQSAMELHGELVARASAAPDNQLKAAQIGLLFPVELLPDAETASAATERLRPALSALKSNPEAFAAEAHAIVERAYRARENRKLPAALALAQTVADAAGDSPQLRESRIEGLDEAMHNQWRLGEFELAEATAHQVLALAHEAAREHWVEPSMYDRLAEICLSRKGFDEAERLARRSMEMIDRVGCRNTSFTSLNFVLARALAGQGKPAEANRAFQQVWQQSDALNLRDEASLAFYEWMAAARSGSDPRFLEDAARCVLAQLATYDESTMDGLHLAWRAMAHGALKGEKAAASDWIRAFEKGLGEDKAYCQLALALLQQGDHATYQRICNELVAKVGTAANEHTSQRIAWTCALGSQPVDDLSVPLDLAANLVEKNPGVATYLCTSGALLYRLGRYEEADGRLRQSIEAFKGDDAKWLSALYPQFFLAMTRWQLGHEADARSLLADLQSQMSDATYSAGPWYRRATLDILRRETEGLITGGSNTRPLPKGEGFESKLGERNED